MNEIAWAKENTTNITALAAGITDGWEADYFKKELEKEVEKMLL